ncbi:TPA: lytic transglycosylase domain-containing protein [Escherichia coli]|uniref:lytic transglycosylase domain-containing protein n=1 Tax=Escherichia coli TaxID=562 RepID=UPI001F1461C8|nr:lytic transglycosylase domain-containing protein [Escherichia coli]MCH6238807.1 lytic transglycosylase domain-containing protein [Escherichia coli]HBB8280967.1 lytic transglycosylase domain-containing protein [Escherichia coli]
MSNAFDFELVANDQVSDVIDRINEAIRGLEPKLDKTKEGLQLGGQETVDGLNGFISRFENLSKSARDNVQFIGDMVPPLKMVGELSGKLGSLGIVGAAGYGLKQVAYGFREASREAYNLDVSSKNAGMRIDDYSRLAGAMRILGADSESANASIDGMAKTLKEAASGANGQVLGALAQIGVQIQKNNDGSVDTLKTLQEIARVFPTLRPEQQKSVADALGLTPEMLALMREGERMKSLLAKSDEFGLTIDPELNQQLGDINGMMNELSASWDGLWQRSKNKSLTALLSDGSVKDGLEGVTDLFTNGDFTGLSHALGFVSSDNAKKLRRIQGDKELYNSLSRRERGAVDGGFYTDAVSKRYDAKYRPGDLADQLNSDLAAINRPSIGGNNNVPYNQGGQYDSIFSSAGKQWNVDPRLLKAIMKQESSGNPYAVSSADARGLMQIMPSNFKATGVTDWTDPQQNIMAGAQILSENLQRSGGNVPLALRYYNGGYDTRRWGRQNQAYPGAVLAHYQSIINSESQNDSGISDAGIYPPSTGGADGSGSIITAKDSGNGQVADNLARSLKEAMSDQKVKLEITLVNDKGEKKSYNVGDNGRITTAMNY